MEQPIQSDGRWYRIEPEVLEIPLALPIYNNFESYQKNIRHPKVMGSKKISPKSNELEESKLNYITEKKEPFFKKNQNKITVFLFSCFFAWILILTIMAVVFGIFYRIPNSIHFFLTNTPTTDNLDQCLRTANSEMFWNGEECESAFGFGSKCSNHEQCQIITQYTFCIDQTCKCKDETREYFNGSKCVPKNHYLDQCTEQQQCLDSESTNCNSTHCVCQETEYFSINKCVSRLGELETCHYTEMCLNDMVCNGTNCVCLGNKLYDTTANKCTDQIIVNNYCDNDWQCSSLKGFTCQSNQCLCPLNTHSWDSSNQECRLTYSTLSCSSDDDCNISENLTCTDFTNRCNCPSNETFKICDCSNSVDKYWNGSSCVDGKSYGLSCNFSFECKVKKENLTCRDNKCQCEENEKFEYNECIEKCPIGTQIFDDRCLDFSTIAEVNLDGQVGSFCDNDKDCSGQLLLPDGSIISTTRCTDHKCECNAPKYTVIGYDPEYTCHIQNSEGPCIYDIECEFNCNSSNNKCAGPAG